LGKKQAGTLTTRQGSDRPLREALITGYLLRLARESAPGGCTQERLAEVVDVSPDTMAGWETGRRPLTAVRAGQFVMLRSTLTRLGAAPDLVRLLGVAMEADQILDHARAIAGRHEPRDFHPLGAYVHRREVIELVAWPLNGRTPAALPAPAVRHGPVATSPDIAPAMRDIVFDHLRRVAETSGADSLLRRQALYLQSYDRRPDAAAWMTDQYRQAPRRRSGWTADWPVVRTLAASLVRYGDPAPLLDFAEYGLADEPGSIANLNYWAYWVGEIPTAERDDSFMPARLGPWHGDRMMRHLASRLDSVEGVADLGTHTLRTLLSARPRLLDEDPALTAALAATAGQLMDGGRMSSSTCRALAEICYAIRLHTR
jgi:transcriptional regulator with XRE-family HTH domain